jgi:hypothetical protein
MDNMILNKFQSVTLPEIAEFGLMDRVEKKYVMHIEDLPKLLTLLPEHLRVLAFDGNPVSLYKTEYFDTHDNRMYLDHHRGKLNRYKIRVRSYDNTRTSYLEIKHKNNKGKTLKTRTDFTFEKDVITDDILIDFIEQNSPYNLKLLHPQITTHYKRTTFIDMLHQIRMTLDTYLSFEDTDRSCSLDNLCIIEIKKHSKDPTYFERTIHELGYKEFSVSKYCLAMVNLKNIKSNRFKSKFNKLNKILI